MYVQIHVRTCNGTFVPYCEACITILQSLFNVHMIQKNKNYKKNNQCIYFSMNLVLAPAALVGPDSRSPKRSW